MSAFEIWRVDCIQLYDIFFPSNQFQKARAILLDGSSYLVFEKRKIIT